MTAGSGSGPGYDGVSGAQNSSSSSSSGKSDYEKCLDQYVKRADAIRSGECNSKTGSPLGAKEAKASEATGKQMGEAIKANAAAMKAAQDQAEAVQKAAQQQASNGDKHLQKWCIVNYGNSMTEQQAAACARAGG